MKKWHTRIIKQAKLYWEQTTMDDGSAEPTAYLLFNGASVDLLLSCFERRD